MDSISDDSFGEGVVGISAEDTVVCMAICSVGAVVIGSAGAAVGGSSVIVSVRVDSDCNGDLIISYNM